MYYPAGVGSRVNWQRLRPEDLVGAETNGPAWAFRAIRAAEPVKSFFFRASEKVAAFPQKYDAPPSDRRVLLGVKACDIAAMRVHERMFQHGEYADPFYQSRVRNTIMIAADCPEPADSCFCNLVGGKPYVESGADVVLSVLGDRFLLESTSPDGDELLALGAQFSQPATEIMIARRDEERAAAVAALSRRNPTQWRSDLPVGLERRATDKAFWSQSAQGCVECFGCLMGCPTCYCYLLYDRAVETGVDRTRVWDACYLAAYQRVGGGTNPRGEFLTRFANRIQCKFQHFKNAHGFYACSGCGRCLATCMGSIDIRRILESA